MLSVPILDDLSYNKLVQLARSRIPALTGGWTDLNDHDPGITTLQTLAWLIDTLNYYIDATGERHRLGYLRLLGIKPEREAARALAAVSGSGTLTLERGAKLMAGSAVFETDECYTGTANRVTALLQETGGHFTELTPFAGVDGEYATLFTYDKTLEPCLYIGFDKELSGGVRFYADVLAHPDRNAFDDAFSLSELCYEYFDGENWIRADLTEDGTRGFLKSGFVGVTTGGPTAPARGHPILPEAHYLRVRLTRNEYDALPRIGKIFANCVNLVQTDTRAQALELVSDGCPELVIGYHVRESDVVQVFAEDGDGYSLWFEHTARDDSLCEVVTGAYPWQRVIRFDKERFGAYPKSGQKLLVTVTDSELYDTLSLGVTTGFACQQMEIDLEDILELRLALAESRNGRAFIRLWDECDNIAGAASDARVFSLDRTAGIVTFGDGINGASPEAGRRVTAVTVKTSLLDLGNVRKGRIDRFLDDCDMTVYNPENATGGKRPKSAAELEPEIGRKINKTTRAVTAQDFEELVGATPGLIIEGVNVISSADYARYYGGNQRPGSVLVAVKPYSGNEPRPALSELYRLRICETMERYRLLTTHVRIIPAKYVGIEASGRIVLTENTAENRRRVEDHLAGLVDPDGGKKFGASLVYGRIFSRLEMLECVVKVTELYFNCSGDGAHRNEQGDIVVYPDAIAFLDKLDIEFA